MSAFELKREDFINQYPPLNLLNKADADSLYNEEPYNLYIHIPFCIHRCDFCYYKVFELPKYKEGIPSEYFNALLAEIEIGVNMFALRKRKCRTIYVGGGTPTLMSDNQFESLFACLNRHIKMMDQSEICFEVRPGPELTSDKLAIMRDNNVTRISMGCQSLSDSILKINGRTHNSSLFIKAYELVKKYNFPTINIDLMSGLCGETDETFHTTMARIVDLAPQNITIYKLELYLNSELYRKAKENSYPLISNAQEAEMVRNEYQYLLNSGYELSDNFSFISDKQHEHIHRVVTWFGEDMIGFGLSSHSRKGNFLYQNDSRLERYIEYVNSAQLPIQRAYKFTTFEDMVREIIFAIKKLNYDLLKFKTKFGIQAEKLFEQQLNELCNKGFIKIQKNKLYTTLDGALFADDIVRIFYPEKQKKLELAHLRRS